MNEPTHQTRLVPPDGLAAWRRRLPPDPTSLAVVTGTFEILQPGNLTTLLRAAESGRCVCALVEDDATAASHLPRGASGCPLADRIELVAALRAVDAVSPLAAPHAARTLAALQPYTWVGCPGPVEPDPLGELARRLAASTVPVPRLPGCATGEIIEAIRADRTPVALPAGAFDPPPAPPRAPPDAPPSGATLNGCFDILHVGHLRFLAASRALGGPLTMMINSDESIRRYKGSGRPVFPLPFRAAALRALRSVDRVFAFDEDEPLALLARLRPAIHIKGGRHEPDRVRHEQELVSSWGGRLAFCRLEEGYSTTSYIRKALGAATRAEEPRTGPAPGSPP